MSDAVASLAPSTIVAIRQFDPEAMTGASRATVTSRPGRPLARPFAVLAALDDELAALAALPVQMANGVVSTVIMVMLVVSVRVRCA